MKENTFVRRTNTIRYNTASKTIELRIKNDNGLALIEKALTKDGFKRRYNDDGYEVLVREWNGNKRTLNRIIKMLVDADAIDDREEKKLYIEQFKDTPKRVVYPLTAAQESKNTRKPTAKELEEIEAIERCADYYEFGDYEKPIKKTKTTTVTIIKKEELNTPEDFLRALANLKSMFA